MQVLLDLRTLGFDLLALSALWQVRNGPQEEAMSDNAQRDNMDLELHLLAEENARLKAEVTEADKAYEYELTERRAAEARIDAALALHREVGGKCLGDGWPCPCPTWKALTGEDDG